VVVKLIQICSCRMAQSLAASILYTTLLHSDVESADQRQSYRGHKIGWGVLADAGRRSHVGILQDSTGLSSAHKASGGQAAPSCARCIVCSNESMTDPRLYARHAVHSRDTASSIPGRDVATTHLDHDLEAGDLAINLTQRKRLLLGAWLRRVCQLVHDVCLLQAFAHQCIRACK
jgi:hypothetical protein